MISIINQLRGVSFYLQALIPCVSILFGNKTGHGVLNHLSISSSDGPFARLLFFFNSLPSSRARSAASSGSQAQQKHIYTPLNSSPVQRMLFQRATQYRRRRKKKKQNKTKQKQQIPLTGFTQRAHTERGPRCAWQVFWENETRNRCSVEPTGWRSDGRRAEPTHTHTHTHTKKKNSLNFWTWWK